MTEALQMDSSLAVHVFSQGDDPIACLNKAMDFLTAVASSSATSLGEARASYSGTGYKGHMERQCTHPKRTRNTAWFKEKAMLAEAQEAGQILDEEQLAFLADPGIPDGQAAQTTIPNNAAFQTEDLDAYDSDCDDVSNAKAILMGNIFNYGSDIISEVVQIVLWYLDSECSKHMTGNRSQPMNFVRSRDTNLYTISLDDMLKTSPIHLLSKASKTKSWLWHRRLSHLNFGTINKLAKDSLARGIPKLKFQKDHLCSTCALGKSKKSSHQPKAKDTNQEKLFLRSKDKVPDTIIKCIKNIQVRLNAIVCNVRTYNGTEFINQTLREFYENVDISHQTSVACTPQQNDVAERRN
ncbi:retrovirus-related pol polyprotein from transposon TNT 1-94 [Tanacetum coccineum]